MVSNKTPAIEWIKVAISIGTLFMPVVILLLTLLFNKFDKIEQKLDTVMLKIIKLEAENEVKKRTPKLSQNEQKQSHFLEYLF